MNLVYLTELKKSALKNSNYPINKNTYMEQT